MGKAFDNKISSLFSSIVIGVCLIIIAVILTTAFLNRNRPNDIISVTGLGSKDFVSDLIVWKGNFSRKDFELKNAYASLNADRKIISGYLAEQGILAGEIVFSAVDITKTYEYYYDKAENERSRFDGYRLTQEIQIESREVDKVESVSREVTGLINLGLEFYSQPPQYYYTKLAELKIEMIAEATRDARLRAEKIAGNSGARIGKLRYADMGVFQIIARNSSEDYTWGGAYNTSAKRKTATITMHMQFGVK